MNSDILPGQVVLGINQLKQLKVAIALFDHARERGWTKAQTEDIASRLVQNPRVRFEAFGDYELDEFATLDVLAELEESGEAEYLFQRTVETLERSPANLVPGTRYTKEQMSKLSSRAKLAIGNRLEEQKRAGSKK